MALALACWWTQPFAVTLIEQQQSMQNLSRAQQTNVQLAAQRLDGLVIPPGAHFSFNQAVGPRTPARGYLAAPSYLGGESPATIGGGICLLSSALYQAALKAGFQIEQRVPHLRTIHSVPPGLDATVWYGGADLRWVNRLSQPVRFRASVQNHELRIRFNGRSPIGPLTLQRVVNQHTDQSVLITVFQHGASGSRMISRDLYRLSP